MRICFVALNAFGAITGGPLGHVGGVERQQALMANWLAERGHDVAVITWAPADSSRSSAAAVRLHFTCRESEGIPVLRFAHPRWTGLVKAMSEADADVYYYNLGDLVLGQIVSWARWKGKQSIYSVSSERLCKRDLREILSPRERVFYRYGVRHADHVLVQTTAQADLLEREYGRRAEVLPMPCVDLAPTGALASPPAPGEMPRVLWVGRFSAEKRPIWLLEIAARCPEVHFDVIGHANRETGYSKSFVSRARAMENVTLHGVVHHGVIGDFYRRAQALVCTSSIEGFPNVFLEAWSAGVPIVTTFDPDSVVSRQRLGLVGEAVDDLASGLKSLLADRDLWRLCSTNARGYFLKHHRVTEAMPRFEAVLNLS